MKITLYSFNSRGTEINLSYVAESVHSVGGGEGSFDVGLEEEGVNAPNEDEWC